MKVSQVSLWPYGASRALTCRTVAPGCTRTRRPPSSSATRITISTTAIAQPFYVPTGSMQPTYPPGTLVVVKPVEAGEVRIGRPGGAGQPFAVMNQLRQFFLVRDIAPDTWRIEDEVHCTDAAPENLSRDAFAQLA